MSELISESNDDRSRYLSGLCEDKTCKKKKLLHNSHCQHHYNENSKREYQQALKDVKTIYVAGVRMSRGMWSSFKLYYINADQQLEIIFFGNNNEAFHWSRSKHVFEDSVVGMNRVFDIVYGLGCYLFNDGYKFKEEFLS